MLCNHFALMTIFCISVNFFSFSRNFSFLVMLHCVFWLISHCVLISVLSFFFFNQFECTYYKIYFNFIFLVKFVKYYHFGRGWIHRYSVKRKPCVFFFFFLFFPGHRFYHSFVNSTLLYCLWSRKLNFQPFFSLKIDHTILFIHLKIICYSIFNF